MSKDIVMINIENIVIRLCKEIAPKKQQAIDWLNASEEFLLNEIIVCIISSQCTYEMTLAVADTLYKNGLSNYINNNKSKEDMIKDFLLILTKNKISLYSKGVEQKVKVRFPRRNSNMIASTIDNIYRKNLTIKYILKKSNHPRHARKLLIQSISGFGPKQSSLFLRRIGYCNSLSVLDSHIIDYLQLSKHIKIDKKRMCQLQYYENIENIFISTTKHFGYDVGCIDLAIWIAIRVLKKEGCLELR